jgi:hypothetical protein
MYQIPAVATVRALFLSWLVLLDPASAASGHVELVAADEARGSIPAFARTAQGISAPAHSSLVAGPDAPQHAVLHEEVSPNTKLRRSVGSVVWRIEGTKGVGGKAGDLAVRADIAIPDRKLKLTMVFRRTDDASSPASHTVEFNFELPADFPSGGIASVAGILMKSDELGQGAPLLGRVARITDSFFREVETDRVRNLQLLKERSWFAVSLVYSNQRRAIIAIEKGSPGERAFNDAFAVWGE